MRKVLMLAMLVIALTVPAYAGDVQQQQSIQLPGDGGETNACDGGPCDAELPPDDGDGGSGSWGRCYYCDLRDDNFTAWCNWALRVSDPTHYNVISGRTGCTAYNSTVGPNGCVMSGVSCWGKEVYAKAPMPTAPSTHSISRQNIEALLSDIGKHIFALRSTHGDDRLGDVAMRVHDETIWMPTAEGLLRAEEIYRAEVSALIGRDLKPGEVAVIPQRRQ